MVRTTNEARLEVALDAGSKRVAISAVLDGKTCELCRELDGVVIDLDDDAEIIEQFTPPFHINDRCILVIVGDDEGGNVKRLEDLDADRVIVLRKRHGHFMVDREKYASIRVVASPGRRDFAFTRVKDPDTGELVSKLSWNRPRYDIPGLADGTIQAGVTELGTRPLSLDLPTTAPAGDGLLGRGGAVGSRQNLRGLKGHLTLTDGADAEVKANLDELALVPRELLQQLSDEGVHFYVGAGDVTGLDDNEDLIGRQPPGFRTGATYRQVTGCYRDSRRQVTIGTGPATTASLPLHETGHAVAAVLGHLDSLELQAHLERLMEQLPTFLRRFGTSQRGRAEFFSEVFATTLMDEQAARLLFDDEVVDWMLHIVRSRS